MLHIVTIIIGKIEHFEIPKRVRDDMDIVTI